MRCLLVIAALVVAAVALLPQRPHHGAEWSRFQSFMRDYKKTYSSAADMESRFAIFKNNLQIIAAHQPRHPHGLLGINEFADMSPEEFRRTHLMPKGAVGEGMPPFNASVVPPFPPSKIPDAYNWAPHGVSPVKNQLQCGSCWAFSATEQVESIIYLADTTKYPNGPPVLSPQQIVDCDHIAGVQGCDGGWSQSAFEYAAKYGLEAESSYPYTGYDGSCRYDASNVVANIAGYEYVTSMSSRNETQMQYWVAERAPISICVDASIWQYYIAGVLSWFCPNSVDDLDHCVQLTGYGIDGGIFSDTNYWIVRNSWGESWGLSGYIWLARDDGNVCGVGDVATTCTLTS